MYSRDRRMKAVELYIQYDQCPSAVIHELGYPCRNLLRIWYKRYLQEQEWESCGNNTGHILDFLQNKKQRRSNTIWNMVEVWL